MRAANGVLLHSPERPPVGQGEPGPIGVALAVVRGNELYVATVGPAEAYLVRQARLLTLPDASPESGLPADETRGPRGLARRDHRRRLPDPHVAQRHPAHRPGPDPGRGPAAPSPGRGRADPPPVRLAAVSAAPAATACCSSRPPRSPPLTRPRRSSRSGRATRWQALPDRSPIPLADTVVDGVAAMQTTARHAQVAADGWLRRGVYGLFDRMPQRPMSRGRVTPMTVRRERQQRAAVAVVGLLAVIAVVGTSMWLLSGTGRSDTIDRQQTGPAGLRQVQADLDAVYGNGRDLMTQRSGDGATSSQGCLRPAQDRPERTATRPSCWPIRGPRCVAGLNRYYHVTDGPAAGRGHLRDRRPDGSGAGTRRRPPTSSTRPSTPSTGQSADGRQGPGRWCGPGRSAAATTSSGAPRLLTIGGGDVLMLDAFNSLWRWHPAAGDTTGRGSLLPGHHPRQRELGRRRASHSHVPDQRSQEHVQLLHRRPEPATDRQVHPGERRQRLPEGWPGQLPGRGPGCLQRSTTCTSTATSTSSTRARSRSTSAARPSAAGSPIRPPTRCSGPRARYYVQPCGRRPGQGTGHLLCLRQSLQARRRVLQSRTAAIVGQYTVAPGVPWLTALTGLFVMPGTNGGPATLYWTEAGSLMKATLAGPNRRDARRPRAAPAPLPRGSSSASEPADRAGSPEWDNPPMAESLAEVVVESVRVHMLSSQHVVLLKETERERYLPIWIGPWEANAIATRLQGVTPERPMTHDLFAATLADLGVKLVRSSSRAWPTRRSTPPRAGAGRPDLRHRRAAVGRTGAGGADRRPDLRLDGGPRPRRRGARDAGGREARGLPRVRQLTRRGPRRGASRRARCRTAPQGVAAAEKRATDGGVLTQLRPGRRYNPRVPNSLLIATRGSAWLRPDGPPVLGRGGLSVEPGPGTVPLPAAGGNPGPFAAYRYPGRR